MINMKHLTMLSHIMVVNIYSIICNQDFREPKLKMIFLQKNNNILLVVISTRASTSTYLVK